MPIRCRLDIIKALKDAGYSSYRIRKETIMGQSTLQRLRVGEVQSIEIVNRICQLLDCQPGDVIEYVKEDETF